MMTSRKSNGVKLRPRSLSCPDCRTRLGATIPCMRSCAWTLAALAFTLALHSLGFSPAVLALPQSTSVTLQAGPSSNANHLYTEGINAARHGDLATARKAFEAAVHADPRNANAHNMLGWVLLAQGETAPAISELQLAIRLKPTGIQALKTITAQGFYPAAAPVPLG